MIIWVLGPLQGQVSTSGTVVLQGLGFRVYAKVMQSCSMSSRTAPVQVLTIFQGNLTGRSGAL